MAPRELPKPSELHAFANAVAGHAGTMCDAEGCLFIKPCVQAEIDFYQQVFDGSHPALADLVPLFMGSLMLNEGVGVAAGVPAEAQKALFEFQQQQQQQELQQPPAQAARLPVVVAPPASADNVTWTPRGSAGITTDRAVVLDNATYGYKKPNVLDVKLGRRLWGDSAPLQKRQRMDEVSTQTTHAKYGFRIAGMRVYQGADGADRTSDGYRVYDKDFGRKEVNDDNVVDAFRQFLCVASAGVDAEHSRAIAQAFKTELERVRDVLERERTRMYSSSLLFVYEGDGAALRAAIAEDNARAEAAEAEEEEGAGMGEMVVVEAEAACEEPVSTEPAEAALAEPALRARSRREARRDVLGNAADRSSSRTDSGIAIDDDSDSDSDDDDGPFVPPIYGLRLIDFAHAKFVPDQDGPDENNLAGVRSLIDIFAELAK